MTPYSLYRESDKGHWRPLGQVLVFPQGTIRNRRDIRPLDEELKRQQIHLDRMQVDTVADAKAISDYLKKVHEMVVELYARQDVNRAKERRDRVHPVTLSADARKGDKRLVSSSDVCRIGEKIIIRGKETRTVLSKRSLIFRFP